MADKAPAPEPKRAPDPTFANQTPSGPKEQKPASPKDLKKG